MGKKTTDRVCGECTACCDGWLKTTIDGQAVAPGSPCQYSTPQGCNNYEHRPQVCRHFRCAWLTNKKHIPDWMRPDRAKVIFYRVNLLGDNQPPVITAVPVGKLIPTRSLNVVKQISIQTGLPLIYVRRFTDKKGNYLDHREFSGFGAEGMDALFQRIQGILERTQEMANLSRQDQAVGQQQAAE